MGVSTLLDPIERYRQVRWSATIGAMGTGVSAVALPVEPLATLSLLVPSLALWAMAHRRVRVWEEERKALGRWDVLPWTLCDEAVGSGIYLGHGSAIS